MKNSSLVLPFVVLALFACMVVVLGFLAVTKALTAGAAFTIAGIVFVILVVVGYVAYKRQGG